jgi:hypothetical protein
MYVVDHFVPLGSLTVSKQPDAYEQSQRRDD